MPVYQSLLEMIGETPLVAVERFAAASGVKDVRLLAKLEKQNPLGSIKDRAALWMIRQAEQQGLLLPGGRIVEPTSGNTGVGLAGVAAVRGYHLTLTMPESMSMERRQLLSALGADIVLTPAGEGMQGAVNKAGEIARETGAFLPSQFDNPMNPAAHVATAQEILRDTGGRLDALVATVGTGGTITGIARELKRVLPGLEAIAVEPSESPLLSCGKAGPHGIQGIGANFVPGNYDASLVDSVLTVSTEQAYASARLLARTEGLLCGISSGAALAAAIQYARRPGMSGKVVCVILPDTGERYLSTPLFEG